jgi:hypothetical protein
MENVGIFYGHLVYFIAIWYTLWPFGILYSHLVYFIDIWYTLWPFGILYSHLVYFIAIWYTLLPFIIMYVWPFGVVCGPCGIFFPFWYVWTKKHLATLITYVSSTAVRPRSITRWLLLLISFFVIQTALIDFFH